MKMNINCVQVSDRIRKSRLAAGYNQPQLARKIGVSKGAVSQWEAGNPIEYKADNILKIAQALRVDPYWLLYGEHRETVNVPVEISNTQKQLIDALQGMPDGIEKTLLDLVNQFSIVSQGFGTEPAGQTMTRKKTSKRKTA